MAEFAALAEQRNIQLQQINEVDVAMIRCDVQRTHQVVANILGNAIKFTAQGSPVLMRLCTGDSGYRLDVVDQGPGIPPDELDSIFERFTQSTKTRTGAGGTGLGLPISKEIMRLQQGRVTARNNDGGGACFSIDFARS